MNEEEKKIFLHLKKVSEERTIIPLDDEIGIILNLIEKLQKENEEWKKAYQEEKDKQFELIRKKQELEEKYDKDTHKLQNDLDIANAKIIELLKENELFKYRLEVANNFIESRQENLIPENYDDLKYILNECDLESTW